jgi:hypothetical protein
MLCPVQIRHIARKASQVTAAGKRLALLEDESLMWEYQKYRISQYLVSQLNLFAEMCLDRNYLAINAIEAKVSDRWLGGGLTKAAMMIRVMT